jgi:CDP-diacylglycerol--glycerol-3-phosphate 3-phosphatidyltransferase
LFDGRFRRGVDRITTPVAGALHRTGISPDLVTVLGLVVAIPAAWAIAVGYLGLGLALLICSAVPDLLDGALAKASGRSSTRGAFFDSVSDRVTDALILGGFAWYLLDTHRGHIAILPMAILGVSFLVSYERAKAESLGFEAKVGLMERAERVVVLCAALAFGMVMIPLLWLMLALTSVTALQRFVTVWRQATAAGHGPPAARRWGSRRGDYEHQAMGQRWRAWREANGWTPRAVRYPGSPRSTAASRWHARRQARLARLSRDTTGEGTSSTSRRRPGTRP